MRCEKITGSGGTVNRFLPWNFHSSRISSIPRRFFTASNLLTRRSPAADLPHPDLIDPTPAGRHQPPMTVGVMTKYWRPGQVKTRLAATIGDQKAADLHQVFLRHLCVALAAAGQRRQLVVTPWVDEPLFASHLDRWGVAADWSLADQGVGDLGQRMQRWFRGALADHPLAILIGADCPLVDADAIATAGESLCRADVVLGPAADGGYYLIGMTANAATQCDVSTLFTDVPWSTGRVHEITLERCRTAGLLVATLPQREDIDTVDELNRLRQLISDDPTQSTLRDSIESVL